MIPSRSSSNPFASVLRSIDAMWLLANRKFRERVPRERLLLILVMAVVVWVAIDFLWVASIRDQRATVGAQIEAQQTKIRDYQGQIGRLPAKKLENPNVATKKEIDQINASLSALEGKLGTVVRSLINGDLLFLALEDVLNRTEGLVLLGLNTLPMERMFQQSTQRRESEVELYKHTIQLRIQGRYFPIVSYLKKLESLPYQFYWEKLDYRKGDNGLWVATLEVYTLSMDAESLGG